jgi:hypothetical protein
MCSRPTNAETPREDTTKLDIALISLERVLPGLIFILVVFMLMLFTAIPPVASLQHLLYAHYHDCQTPSRMIWRCSFSADIPDYNSLYTAYKPEKRHQTPRPENWIY